MNLKQLEAFVQVSESGSFSKAAKELFLTQPTISVHISSLEKELNVRLFIRNTKEVSLSDDGKDLYRYAKQITDLEKAIEERFYMDSDDGKHFITIAASTIPAQYLLPKILMCYRERYPKEQIKIMETDSSEVVTQVVDHMVDVGFTGTVLEKKHCKYIPFYKDELAVITPDTPEYRILKEQNRDDIDWIKRKPLILREEGSGTRKEAEKQLKSAGISMETLDIVASIANQETIKKSVKQGMGITVLSRLAAEDEDGLLIFPIPGADEGRDINLVYNKNYQMTRSADRFIRIVKEVYDIE
ncbi:LysR family transcriptional regulator [Dorea formicigenerans]|uniref:selenium metabolism-associated LysR family transcriptional regulator n=1 Tax=Dorea formicigenerans TaxID=39486 RepID=UPI001D07EAE7|nr:selenium metabolism-associated LysR family transcriptional regulator [Dorea formicigenerans]MCB6379990.1 LysR family transcriptional regulator [Dorea formicigenerans]MCB6383134.1 LysR family transcriptional regulator [Dorea formicigenerans]MCB6388112.1 LysR family transcriptional regulator [Dorea formicigenerans]MCB6397203.1 LysR family transcriptional regulator [Dorea formicigenerans]MCB6408519.1 LysR family transcriptional regulator [Dorea formicigenerans]